jgi:hypothetical protein
MMHDDICVVLRARMDSGVHVTIARIKELLKK